MNGYTLVSAWLREYDYNETSGDVSSVRAKGNDKLNEVSDEWWHEFDGADFQQKYDESISTAANSSSAALPSDFLKTGSSGGVAIVVSSTDIRPLTFLPIGELRRKQRENAGTTDIPEFYSIGLQTGTTDIVRYLQFDCKADAAYVLQIDYMKVPPTITDVDTSVSGLQFWPAEYHTTLLKGVLARGARIMGDTVRQQQFEGEWQRSKAIAMANRVHGQDDDERSGRGGYAVFRNW
jgi:hypothetical protein